MNRVMKIVLAVLALALVSGAAFANPRGTEIMTEVSDFKEPKFTRSQVVMTLTEKNGSKEVRQLLQYGKEEPDKNGEKKTYVVMDFKSPASVKDTRFLQIENKNAADDKWIYLPSLKATRRVNSSEGSKSFMGTDATYDDMSSREIEEDDHEYLRDESITVEGGAKYDCYVVKETPIDKKSSQYAYRMVWVDKDSMYPVHTEMFDKSDKLVKVLDVMKIVKMKGATGEEYDIPMSNILKNVQSGHSTQIEIVKIEIDKELPPKVFTQNFLNTGKI